MSVLAWTANSPSTLAGVCNIPVPALKCQSAVSGSLHMQELAAMELASSRAGGLWLGWANSLSSQAIIGHGSPSQLDRTSQ